MTADILQVWCSTNSQDGGKLKRAALFMAAIAIGMPVTLGACGESPSADNTSPSTANATAALSQNEAALAWARAVADAPGAYPDGLDASAPDSLAARYLRYNMESKQALLQAGRGIDRSPPQVEQADGEGVRVCYPDDRYCFLIDEFRFNDQGKVSDARFNGQFLSGRTGVPSGAVAIGGGTVEVTSMLYTDEQSSARGVSTVSVLVEFRVGDDPMWPSSSATFVGPDRAPYTSTRSVTPIEALPPQTSRLAGYYFDGTAVPGEITVSVCDASNSNCEGVTLPVAS